MLERIERTYEALPPGLRWFLEVKYCSVESKIFIVLSRLGLVRPRLRDAIEHEVLDEFINSVLSRLGLSYRYQNLELDLELDKLHLEMCLSAAHENLSYKRKGMLMTGALPDALIDVDATLRQVAIWQKQCASTIDIDMVHDTLFFRRLSSTYDTKFETAYCDLTAIWLLNDTVE